MKVILIEPVENLGLPGDVVSVKAGYARNFLLPKRKALKATDASVREAEHQRRLADSRRRKLVKDLGERAAMMRGHRLEFSERATIAGKLYGSVSARRIAEALDEAFGNVMASWVQLSDAIKQPGEHTVPLKLAPDVTSEIVVVVHAEVDEAEAAAAAEAEAEAAAAAAEAGEAATDEVGEGDDAGAEAPDAGDAAETDDEEPEA